MSIFDSIKNAFRIKGEIFKIMYEGNTIIGMIYRPKKPNGSAVIYCHGGFTFGGELDYPEAEFLTRMGYTILLLKYENEQIEKISLLDDIQEAYDAGRMLRNKYRLKGKIFIMGVSRGGFVALHTMIKHYDFFDGCIDVVGPTSLPEWELTSKVPKAELEKFMKYFDYKNDKTLSSPIMEYDLLAIRPLLMLYGLKDVIVPPEQGKLLAAKVTSAKFLLMNHTHGMIHEEEVQRIINTWMGRV